MRKILLALSVCTLLSISACKEDACESVNCQNNGTCVDGTCECPIGFVGPNCQCPSNSTYNSAANTCDCIAGYEGSDCNTEERLKFLGVYLSSSEVCTLTGTAPNYQITVTSAASGISNVVINNLYIANSTSVLQATVSGSTITIPFQTIGTFTIQGSGTFLQTNLDLTFTVNDGMVTETCNSTFVKQ